jgi:Alpha/beta hydrolase family
MVVIVPMPLNLAVFARSSGRGHGCLSGNWRLGSWVAIEGGNHAQFGWYGPQSSDGIATISRQEQQKQIVVATMELLSRLAAPGS